LEHEVLKKYRKHRRALDKLYRREMELLRKLRLGRLKKIKGGIYHYLK